MSETKLGWHFVGETLRDGRPIPPDGEWRVHDGPVVPRESGLHMSEHPFDALQYAPGPILCRVELRGDLQSHGVPIDKWVGRERRIIKRIDATHLLRRFAADEALSVAHLWDMPVVVRNYLETLDESKQDAAREAATGASWAAWAAWDAAMAAAWAAARDAAREAWAASWASWASWAAWDAARDAAWAAARKRFLAKAEEAMA